MFMSKHCVAYPDALDSAASLARLYGGIYGPHSGASISATRVFLEMLGCNSTVVRFFRVRSGLEAMRFMVSIIAKSRAPPSPVTTGAVRLDTMGIVMLAMRILICNLSMRLIKLNTA